MLQASVVQHRRRLYNPPSRLLQARQHLPRHHLEYLSIVLWAGTEINLGGVTAYLPSLLPMFLLITKGSAQPGATKGSRQFNNNTSRMKSKAVRTFGFKGRNIKSYPAIDSDNEHHPFSQINDRDIGGNKSHTADGSATTHGEDIDLQNSTHRQIG